MNKYTKILFLILISRAFISLVFVPMFGDFAVTVECILFFICCISFGIVCKHLRNVKTDGEPPSLLVHFSSTITFSGLLLTGYPLVLLVQATLPTMSFKLNQFSRLQYGINGAQVVQVITFLALLFASVALVKTMEFKLSRVTVLLGGLMFVLMSVSLQNVLADFLFGCFILTYIIRFGSVFVAGVYLFLYKFISMYLDLWIYTIIGDTQVSFFGSLGEILGTLCLFGSVLLAGIYIDVRFIENKKKMPLFSAFTISAIITLIIVGYFTLNYYRI